VTTGVRYVYLKTIKNIKKLENNSRKPRDLTKSRHSSSLKKGQLILSQGKMKKGADFAVYDNNDVVRTSQRWASPILVCTSAIPQYCGQPKRLRNCELKKLRNCDCGPSKFDFFNSATLCSLRPLQLLSCPFSSAQDVFKNQPKNFYNILSMETKHVPYWDSSTRFLTSNFFSWIVPIWIPDSYPKFGRSYLSKQISEAKNLELLTL
jgi:hypothetical protein